MVKVMVSTRWQDTAQGRALFIDVADRHVGFAPEDLGDHAAEKAALSLWEGWAGRPAGGAFARWRWRRGLRRLTRAIARAIAEGGEA